MTTSTWSILVIIGVIVVIVLACRYMWNLKQEIAILKEQARDFVTLQEVETHVATLDRQTLKEAIQHTAASQQQLHQLQQRVAEMEKEKGRG